MPRKIRRGRSRKIISMREISLTPLIDTALTLLIIFMITAPMMQNSIKVQLPKGKTKEADTVNKEIRVVVDKDVKMFLNGVPMGVDHILKTVGTIVNPKDAKSIFVEAHKEIAYGVVLNLIDKLKDVEGVDNVVFVMDTLG